MKELYLNNQFPGEWYVFIGIFLLCLIVTWGLVYILLLIIKKLKAETFLGYRKFSPIGFGIFATVLLFFLFYYPITYSLDYSFKNVNIESKYIEEIIEPTANYDYRIRCSDSSVYITFDTKYEEIKNNLEYFLSQDCEIEYYKLSKVIISIKELE